jgi:hypothetical protein
LGLVGDRRGRVIGLHARYLRKYITVHPRLQIGEIPVTLTRPDRYVVLDIFVRSFYRSLIARCNRQGVSTPPPRVY